MRHTAPVQLERERRGEEREGGERREDEGGV
jgi:hypothetical protein